jgi:transposase
MKRFIEGEDRSQSTLFPEHLDDYIAEDNPVRVIDVFVDELDLQALGFEGMQRRIARWEHEDVLDKMQKRLNRTPQAARIRRQTVEHPFGTIKAWMGATHFLTKTIPRVSTEMSLHILAYNLKRAVQVVGIAPLMKAMRA